MNRRRMMKLSATAAAAAVGVTTRNVHGDDNPIRPAALQRTGRPALSTFEAVKATASGKAKELLPEVAEYFQHYGANFAPSGNWTNEQAANYTRFIQRSFREKETGSLTLDQAAHLLTRKRCGRPDPTPAQLAAAVARWKYTNPTWWPDPLMNTNLDPRSWAKILADAWDAWRKVSPLTPMQSTNAGVANCIHSSGAGRTDGFDGPSGVLAWAELPPTPGYTGRLMNRFDAAEQWTASSDERSIRALNVATHEIGHLLGLEHSSDPSALMAPFYDPDVPAPVADDIRRIKSLYPVALPKPGGPVDPPVPPVDPPVPPVDPPSPPVDPGPTDPPCGRRPRWFPALPRLFPRRRGTC